MVQGARRKAVLSFNIKSYGTLNIRFQEKGVVVCVVMFLTLGVRLSSLVTALYPSCILIGEVIV